MFGTVLNKSLFLRLYTAQKMKLSVKDCLSKSEQIRIFLRIWSHLLKKSLMENFIFCIVIILRLGKLYGQILEPFWYLILKRDYIENSWFQIVVAMV